jgi:transposase-like protein
MNIHLNARLTPKGRAGLVQRILAGETVLGAAAAAGVSEQHTARHWLQRYRAEGPAGLPDRSSRPHHIPHRTPEPIVARVIALRRQRWAGHRIAARLAVSPTTVSRILRRAPTAKPNASSRPLYEDGLTLVPTALPSSVPFI